MHDLLTAVGRVQSISSVPGILRNIATVGAAALGLFLWGYDAPWARVVSFIAVDAVLFLVIIRFLAHPLEMVRYVLVKLLLLFLSLFKLGLVVVFKLLIPAIIAIIYFISPIDLIPDIVLGIGWVDDLGVVIGLVIYAINTQVAMPSAVPDDNTSPAVRYLIAAALATFLTYLLRGGAG